MIALELEYAKNQVQRTKSPTMVPKTCWTIGKCTKLSQVVK